MERPAKLVGRRRELDGMPPLGDVAISALVPAVPGFSRGDAASLAAAVTLHLAVIGVVLAPQRQLGVGGVDLQAIGIEIVTVAPAAEARRNARGRAAPGGERHVAEVDGDDATASEVTASVASRREDAARVRMAPPPPDPLPVETSDSSPVRTSEPSEAEKGADGEAREPPEALRPSVEERRRTSSDSLSAAEVLARFRGGAASRGPDVAMMTPEAMAAARAGQRDAYQEAVVKEIVQTVRAVQNDTGQAGQVRLVFRVERDGTIGDVRIAATSNSRELDALAVSFMRGLRLPVPPATLKPEQLLFEMPITFPGRGAP